MKNLLRLFVLLSIQYICVLVPSLVFATEDTPKIAVYVTGGRNTGEGRALTAFILASLIRSGKYEAVERSEDFVTQIIREQETQRSGAVDDSQIRRLGIQAGVQFVCVADITSAFGAYQMSARIINVETAKVVAIGVANSDMESMAEMEILANDIVAKMLGLKNANEVLGESAADKRRQEKADAERRKRMEIDRRKRAEAREREEEAVRREKEKAEKIEQKEQKMAEKIELQMLENRLAELKGENIRGDEKWRVYSVGARSSINNIWAKESELGGRYGEDVYDAREGEIEILLTARKKNGHTWEPRIDLMAGFYFEEHRLDTDTTWYGIEYLNTKKYYALEFAAFNGWTVLNTSGRATKWHWYLGYGAAAYLGGEGGTGLGLGGQIGIEYDVRAEKNYNEYITLLTLNLDVRPMYRIIFTGMKDHYFGFTIGLSASFTRGFFD